MAGMESRWRSGFLRCAAHKGVSRFGRNDGFGVAEEADLCDGRRLSAASVEIAVFGWFGEERQTGIAQTAGSGQD